MEFYLKTDLGKIECGVDWIIAFGGVMLSCLSLDPRFEGLNQSIATDF
jgi:hypothetical protein